MTEVADFVKILRLQATQVGLDTGAGVARLRGYSGTQAASLTASPSGVLLFEIALFNPSSILIGTALTLQFGVAPVGLANGTLTWGRLVSASGATVLDMVAGLLSSTAPLRVTSLTVASGAPIGVRLGQIT